MHRSPAIAATASIPCHVVGNNLSRPRVAELLKEISAYEDLHVVSGIVLNIPSIIAYRYTTVLVTCRLDDSRSKGVAY